MNTTSDIPLEKPGKFWRAITLRPIEWIPVLAGLVIGLIWVLWWASRISDAIHFGDMREIGSFQAEIRKAHKMMSIGQSIQWALVSFGVVCWIRRVIAIIGESPSPPSR